ncbi:methyltransferase family protein [Anaerobacterium chartisolvens]|uniref:Methyltransferase family protein n=1 Tax=Anaerobacterium chartisolvens TaxID=1297424 RepID=A0A369B9Y3_9FIRM|nr:class I SAM-dependent methyltransferase [Anaerobacterium chartisolvens]RCX18332.1 methyltransferase family protein [Anaerobacterium chartisolvens]
MYRGFAYIYDKLMYDVDYEKWVCYIQDIFKKNEVSPSLVLDLGCGTGNFCIEMAQKGFDMIGIDISPDMLSCAREKSIKKGLDNILYLNQDMRDFELYGTVDAIVCLMDSVNYITAKNDVKKIFKLVANYLNPEGLFIFDINSCYKLKDILGNNLYYDIGDDAAYIWQNSYEAKKRQCIFDLTFFIRRGELFEKCEEVHSQRAYSVSEIESMLSFGGLKTVSIFDSLTFNPPHSKSERIFFVSKKICNK